VRDGLSHEVVLRLEVRIEAAVGESGTGHDLHHSDALDPLTLDRRSGLGEDAGARSLLVVGSYRIDWPRCRDGCQR
jgi:hypothetical protein